MGVIMRNILKQDFCIYCQKEFKTPEKMQEHVLEEHPGTYAATSITEAHAAQGTEPPKRRTKAKARR